MTRASPGRARLVVASLLLIALAQRATAQSAQSDSAAIHAVSRDFSAAYVRGDAAAMAALYTEDAVIFPGESDRIAGRAAIAKYWAPRPGRRITRHVITPARITVDGKHAYDYGTFEISGERDGKAWGPSRGKYVAVWRREAAGWRLYLDIWNSGPPEKARSE